ncbi:hypothetical protein LPB140_00355 [Sphingorhabdus lutea]|uniref:Uncharacterized protein n=1 Tax=Sphingorhabdus lutea TaxID=1913578 RepID=A0A1L3J8T9_9SPHN|nr:YeeE/YedE thiosulfate transporter family protein [Sphingorhabdus lutea]APG61552.1 hypothetical protein LPB140_00355 [Sphingorhabdus lutea]
MLASFPNALPIEGFIGGLAIGLAAAIMLLALGRIAGVSGLAARAVNIADGGAPRGIAIIFIIGLPLGAYVTSLFMGAIETNYPESLLMLIIGGLCVGYGTRLGSGCTSGHGVCGMSRLSPRSLIATIIFMLCGMIIVAAMRYFGLIPA